MKKFTALLTVFLCSNVLLNFAKAQQVDSIEYFLNADPGFGNGTGIPATHAADIADLSFSVDITSLSYGFNNLYVRSHSSDGHWSATNRWLFFKDKIPATSLSRLEYFIDTDPGFGNATNIGIAAIADISDVTWAVDISGYSNGFHTIYIRSRDNNGNWSLSNRWLFFKDKIPAASLSRLEYFIDTDPGFGNATNIGIAAIADISDVTWAVDISGYSNGFHTIYIRSRDNNGNWSLTNRWLFFKDKIPAANISRLEYFVDTDPGFGNGTAITVSASADVSDVTWAVDVSGLTNGFHNIFIRSRDDNGNWSLTNRWLFFKDKIPASNISRLEYFVDTDPGFGNATAIGVASIADVADVTWAVDVSGFTNGFHNVYIRSRDNNGNWSLTSRWLFFKDKSPATAVAKMEYFVDTDPGFGNATDVPVSANADISDLLITVNTTLLSEGFHKIFLRSSDDAGNWSITNRWGFFKEFMPVPLNIKAGEYFFDTDPGFGNGAPIPLVTPLGSDVADFNFNIDITALNNAPHYLFVRNLDSNNKWSITNVIQFSKAIVVPVSWLSFNAQLLNKVGVLTWETSSEYNSSHFEIERSTNGYQFEKLGSVQASGNSTSTKKYQFTDRLPAKGINYYRIRQVDINNQYKYSDIRKIITGTDVPLFALYNTASNGADIILRTEIQPSVLGIFDIAGKKLREIAVASNTTHIDLSALPSGTYTAVLYKNGAVLAVEKMIIRH